MPEHKYMTERIERKTHIKGSFKGKFEGRLDPAKSDGRYERFYDIDILDGDIYTTQLNLLKWSDKRDLSEFSGASSFTVKNADGMRVTLQDIDHSEKYFKIKLKELKLINCRLSQQTHVGHCVYGLLEGDVLSYMLHTDTYVSELGNEKIEEKAPEVKINWKEKEYVPPEKEVKDKIPTSPSVKHKKWNYQLFLGRFSLVLLLLSLSILSKKPILILLALVFSLVLVISFYNTKIRVSLRGFFKRFFTPSLVLVYILITIFLAGVYGVSTSNNVSGAVAERSRQIAKANKAQKDSFNHHFESGKNLLLEHNNNEALARFEKASEFASPENEVLVNNETNRLYASLANEFEKEKEYKKAIEVYSNLVRNNPRDPNFLYSRALCYIKSVNTKEAVQDLRKAMELGDKPATLLYDKINPLKRKLAYTVIRCRDGTISSSTSRRGTCSHHGGVENWNEPVYEEYREYQ